MDKIPSIEHRPRTTAAPISAGLAARPRRVGTGLNAKPGYAAWAGRLPPYQGVPFPLVRDGRDPLAFAIGDGS